MGKVFFSCLQALRGQLQQAEAQQQQQVAADGGAAPGMAAALAEAEIAIAKRKASVLPEAGRQIAAVGLLADIVCASVLAILTGPSL